VYFPATLSPRGGRREPLSAPPPPSPFSAAHQGMMKKNNSAKRVSRIGSSLGHGGVGEAPGCFGEGGLSLDFQLFALPLLPPPLPCEKKPQPDQNKTKPSTRLSFPPAAQRLSFLLNSPGDTIRRLARSDVGRQFSFLITRKRQTTETPSTRRSACAVPCACAGCAQRSQRCDEGILNTNPHIGFASRINCS